MFTHHALERMDERGITTTTTLDVLRNGRAKGEVREGKKDGDWIVKIVRNVLGGRDVGVVTAVVRKGQLVVITVEWEDVR